MVMNVHEYIKHPRDERMQHIDLSACCIEIGADSRACRGILSYWLNTTIPKGMKIHLCHACDNDKCSNPKHAYWGTPKENFEDTLRNGRRETGTKFQKYKW